MADYFSRPVRLTRSEALALYLKGKALLGAPGLEEAPALSTALAKIERGLGEDTLAGLADRVEVDPGGTAARALAAVRAATERRERVEIEYYETERTVQRADGALEVTLPTKDLPWAAKLILRLGGEATVLEPPELSAMVADTGRRTLSLYRRDADGTGFRRGPDERGRGRF